MKTILLEGEQQKFEYLYKAITLDDKDKNLIPYEVEIRVYVVDVDDNNYNGDETSDEDFMTMAEADGRVYSLDGFQNAFNFGEVNTNIDFIRFITQPLNS